MKLGLLSDCHIEKKTPIDCLQMMLPDKGSVDLMILIGDITEGSNVVRILTAVRDYLGVDVLFVPGNHEYYTFGPNRLTLEQLESQWRSELSRIPGVHFLQNSGFEMDGISFFGSTWWSNLGYCEETADALSLWHTHHLDGKYIIIGDDYYSHPMTAEHMFYLNLDAKEKYLEWLKTATGKKVLMTHFPMLRGLGHPHFKQSNYFVSHDDEFISAFRPDVLLYGHVHWNKHGLFNGIPCHGNMFGMESEYDQINFDRNFKIDL